MSDVFTEDYIKQESLKIAETFKEQIETTGTLQPQVVWLEPNGKHRVIMMPDTNREGDARQRTAHALKVISASAFDVDRMAFIMDTYGVKAEFVPNANGEPPSHEDKLDQIAEQWPGGSMQEEWESNGPRKHMLTEGLTVNWADRAGWTASGILPYERQEDGTIVFNPEQAHYLVEGDGGAQVFGPFAEMMVAAMTETKLLDSLAELHGAPEGGFSDDHKLLTLCAGVKLVIQEHHFPLAIPCYSEEEADLLNNSFSGEFGVEMLKPEED